MIYIICPVRNGTPQEIIDYVHKLESTGAVVHLPPRDVNQNCETGVNICKAHKQAMIECDEVHIFWDSSSYGSHFDLGMAFSLNKKIKLVQSYNEDIEGKSYLKVIKTIQNETN